MYTTIDYTFFFSDVFIFNDNRMICPNNCGRRFKYKNDMNYHYKNECGVKFICVICSKQLSQKSHLKHHMALVHKCFPV